MMTAADRTYVVEHAYVPEHLPHYVSAISRTEPALIGDFVVHVVGAQLVFVGYPLGGTCAVEQMMESFEQAKRLFKPTVVSLIAPALPATLLDCPPSPPDAYYRLDLIRPRIPPQTRNMVRRARRQLSVSTGTFGDEHQHLVADFVHTRRLDQATRSIFQRLPAYLECDTTLLIEARDPHGNLVAFDVAEFGARHFAFYMFNFRASQHHIPGASDLLLAELIGRAQAEGKRYLNLGLGIDAGITFFKTKWGATPFLSYAACVQQPPPTKFWERILDAVRRC